MKRIESALIRNVLLLGGNDSGKTTLVKAMEAVSRLVYGDGQNDSSDTDKGITHFNNDNSDGKYANIVSIKWEDRYKINLIDVSGKSEYAHIRENAGKVADSAIIVVDGNQGVNEEIEEAWKLCEKYKFPRIIFVTSMDIDEASYRSIINDLTERFGECIAPFQMPVRKDGHLIGYINVRTMTGRMYNSVNVAGEMQIPEYSKEYLRKYREKLVEAVTKASIDTIDRNVFDESESDVMAQWAIRMACVERYITPVMIGSGYNYDGVASLITGIVKYLLSPTYVKTGINIKTDEYFDCVYSNADSFVALIFDVINNEELGEYSLIKVFSGKLRKGMTVLDVNKNVSYTVDEVYHVSDGTFKSVRQIASGDIGAVFGLKGAESNDTLAVPARPIRL